MRLYVFDDIARINSIVKKGDEAVTICAAAARGWRRERCVCVRVPCAGKHSRHASDGVRAPCAPCAEVEPRLAPGRMTRR